MTVAAAHAAVSVAGIGRRMRMPSPRTVTSMSVPAGQSTHTPRRAELVGDEEPNPANLAGCRPIGVLGARLVDDGRVHGVERDPTITTMTGAIVALQRIGAGLRAGFAVH
jgi:hypothetical protein